MVIIAIAIFRDVNPSQPSPAGWPDPLAYNGVLAFWVVAVDFFVWMVVMSVMMMKVIGKDEQRLRNLPSRCRAAPRYCAVAEAQPINVRAMVG